MGLGLSSIILVFCGIVLLQCLEITEGHWKNHLQFPVIQGENSGKNSHDHLSAVSMDPSLNIFFSYDGLKAGNKMSIYFPTKDPSTSPHLLSKEESDSIPFSLSQFPYILELFSFPEGSKHAKAMRNTLHHCEFTPIKGEAKFCATSLESMLDWVRGILGLNSQIKVLTTNYITEKISSLQNYTINGAPVEILVTKIVSCHNMPYPYAVFYCHGLVSDNIVYKVSLVGDDGGKVEAAAICHMDTSQWDPNHTAFQVLKTRPGASPVCHFFPADNLVWIRSSTNDS